MPDNKQIDQFLAAISEETRRHRAETERQTRLQIAGELEKAESEALKESYRYIQREAAAVRSVQGRRVSAALAESNKKYLNRREEIFTQIAACAAEKLQAYTKTDAYHDFLKTSAECMAAGFRGEAFTLYISPLDTEKQDWLQSVSGASAVAQDENIKIGGLRAEGQNGTACLDDTLDTRLVNGRALLYQKITEIQEL